MPVKTPDLPDLEHVQRSPQESSALVSSRKPRRRPPRRWIPLYKRWWVWVLLTLAATTGGGTLASIKLIAEYESELPDTAEVLTFVRDGTLTIKAADGTILQQLGPATRDKLSLEEMPEQLIHAFIASEDKNFYDHDGVDYQAIARAFRANMQAGEVVEGGSTITQQLARIVFLDQDRSLERKFREALLARKIERDLDKDQVLERYLNLVYLGSGAYGVADAAWIYFSKTVDELTLSEMAMIAGMPPAPSIYSPMVNLDLAEQRRNTVLRRMMEAGFLTTADMEGALAEPLELNPSEPRYFSSEFPYFTIYIQQELPNYVSPEQLELGGLTVETTLNLEWQRLAQETVSNAIANYGPGQNFTQASLVVIDPRSGEIQAMIGGNDFSESQFNRAVQAQRQPGSTFKTFVYTTAIAAGFSPYKTYVDAKFVVDGYEPQNYGRSYRGTVSIRDALISSINIVAVKALIDVGFDPVIDMAHRMGIESELQPTYSLALGAWEVNLLELTSAYGTLANQGNHMDAHGIVRILDRYGEVIYEADWEPEEAVDADTAAIMTWMLQGVVNGGTGTRAALPDRQVAGKTGTSEERRDLWFIGYIPQLVVGVWLGNDDNQPTWGASSTAARVWREFMIEITDEIPPESFPDLPGLEGREGSIEADPVNPRRVTSGGADEDEEDDTPDPAAETEPDDMDTEEATDAPRITPEDLQPAPSPEPRVTDDAPAVEDDAPPPVEDTPPPVEDVSPPVVPPVDPLPLPPPSPPPAPIPAPVEDAPAPETAPES
jgi:penicillin-binding protein 1A